MLHDMFNSGMHKGIYKVHRVLLQDVCLKEATCVIVIRLLSVSLFQPTPLTTRDDEAARHGACIHGDAGRPISSSHAGYASLHDDNHQGQPAV